MLLVDLIIGFHVIQCKQWKLPKKKKAMKAILWRIYTMVKKTGTNVFLFQGINRKQKQQFQSRCLLNCAWNDVRLWNWCFQPITIIPECVCYGSVRLTLSTISVVITVMRKRNFPRRSLRLFRSIAWRLWGFPEVAPALCACAVICFSFGALPPFEFHHI